MPLVRIALPKGKSPEYRKAVSAGVQRALVETFDVPKDDLFQVITEHGPGTEIVLRHASRDCLFRRPDAHPAHGQRHAQPRAEEEAFPAHRRSSCREPRAAARGHFHQPRRDEEGRLVVRQRRGAVRVTGGVEGQTGGLILSARSRVAAVSHDDGAGDVGGEIGGEVGGRSAGTTMSSGLPARPSGVWSRKIFTSRDCCAHFSSAAFRSVQADGVTRTPSLPSSAASARVKPSTPCLDVV